MYLSRNCLSFSLFHFCQPPGEFPQLATLKPQSLDNLLPFGDVVVQLAGKASYTPPDGR
jgi:hypothetical protein